ncbi:DedA family protein [Aureimonas sp. AU22]|jgi:membrane protein DedA with SNARE-associated domain|uniref:DedA family protein n=1 Tax=Aureimonas sp. AU22 TaxID=1638162 RepID=UPI000784B5DE|nr:DedA family protein [Aureimonas sp. AU22]
MLETITGFLQDYGYGILFLSIFLESTGLPFPGESILIAAGIMAGHGQLNVWGVFFSAWIGGTLGDNLGYWLGHRYGRRFVTRYGHKIGLTEEKYRYVEERFKTVGPPIVLIARFILLLRQVCGFAAGTLRFPWWSFLFYNALGAALWSGAYGFGSYILGDRIDTYLHGSPWAYAAIGAVFLILSGGTVLQFRRKLKAQRATEIEKAP